VTITDTHLTGLGAALSPAESQLAFRAVLDALARPGLPARLPVPEARGVPLPPVVLPLLALADLGTGVCLLGADDVPERDWAGALSTATSAPRVPLEGARLVGAAGPISGEEIRRLRRGTALAPEDGALLALAVAALAGGPRRWWLSGPGVPGRRAISPLGVPDEFLAARADAVAGYPAGIDVLLVAPDGGLLGLPRTTTINEERN
jgi:alpha-D-ribose 1-methylphosphonate 5-triphosphate synthase subunit PhnH